LRDLLFSAEEPTPYRLAAARALSVIRATGSEEDAARLLADKSKRATTSRLLAATLLQKHAGEQAIQLLQKLAEDKEPAVAGIALARLVEIDTRLVVPELPIVLASADAEVRSFGVEVLWRQPSETHVRLLAERLRDSHPD